MLLSWAKMLSELNQFDVHCPSKVEAPVAAHVETHPHTPAKFSDSRRQSASYIMNGK
jgi:hypothetical protein